jgi:phosphoenolpyruvate carboxylase
MEFNRRVRSAFRMQHSRSELCDLVDSLRASRMYMGLEIKRLKSENAQLQKRICEMRRTYRQAVTSIRAAINRTSN